MHHTMRAVSSVCFNVIIHEIMLISDADSSVNSLHLTCTGLWALLDRLHSSLPLSTSLLSKWSSLAVLLVPLYLL